MSLVIFYSIICYIATLLFIPSFESGGLNILNKCCRRERDHSEAERAQHIKQMRDIQEHIQEKERQLIELQEQVCIFAFMVCASVVILK